MSKGTPVVFKKIKAGETPKLDPGSYTTGFVDEDGNLLVKVSGEVNIDQVIANVDVSGADPDGSPATENPIKVAGKDGDGNVQTVLVKDTGELDLPSVVSAITNVQSEYVGRARQSLPTPVAEDAAVKLLTDLFGRLLIKGYNASTDSLNVTETSPFEAQTLTSILFDAATDEGISSAVNVELFSLMSVQVNMTGDAVVEIQTSNDGDTWNTESTITNANDVVDFVGARKYIRAEITGYTSGAVTVIIQAKV